MGVYRVDSPAAAQQRAIRRGELKDSLLKKKIEAETAAARRSGREKRTSAPGRTAKAREKTRLYEDILSSIVAEEPRGRFAATDPQILHFSISDEPQKAKGPGERYEGSPADWQWIDPKHLAKLRKMGSPIKSITIEGGGGLSPKKKTLQAYDTLLHGGAERGDPNEIGMLRGPPMSTQQAQQLMATGGTAPAGPPQMAAAGPGQARPGPGGRQPGPDFTGRMPITSPTTGVGGGDLGGMMSQINQQGYPGTDLTQWAQQPQYVGKPKPATSELAIYRLAQQEGILPKTKEGKLITVYRTDESVDGPETMRVYDTPGPAPQGYTYAKPGATMTLESGTKTLEDKTRPKTRPAGPAQGSDEAIARNYLTVAKQELANRGIKDPDWLEIRELAEQLARADGR